MSPSLYDRALPRLRSDPSFRWPHSHRSHYPFPSPILFMNSSTSENFSFFQLFFHIKWFFRTANTALFFTLFSQQPTTLLSSQPFAYWNFKHQNGTHSCRQQCSHHCQQRRSDSEAQAQEACHHKGDPRHPHHQSDPPGLPAPEGILRQQRPPPWVALVQSPSWDWAHWSHHGHPDSREEGRVQGVEGVEVNFFLSIISQMASLRISQFSSKIVGLLL